MGWRRRQWCSVVCRGWARRVRARNDVQIRWFRRRLRRGAAQEGFHLHHHQLLSSKLVVAYSTVVLALLGDCNIAAIRLQHDGTRERLGCDVVPGTERLLLHDSREGLFDNSSACSASDVSSDAFSDAAAHAAAHSASNPTGNAWRSCRPLQLRSRPREHLERGQEGVVLSDSSSWVPTDSSPADAHSSATEAHHASADADLAASCTRDSGETCRPVQLRRWFRQLASRLVGAEERGGLSRPWQGVPQPGWWVRDIFGALRLQRGFRQLASRLERCEEGVVLLQQRQGLPSCGWRLCLDRSEGKSRQWRWLSEPSSGASGRTRSRESQNLHRYCFGAGVLAIFLR